MIAKFSPTPDSLVALFKRRGIASHYVSFWTSSAALEPNGFGRDLEPGEYPVFRISPSPSGDACWMTTKRLIWADSDGRYEIALVEIVDAAPRDFYKIAPVGDADFLKILTITTKGGRQCDIKMPDTGILHGMWGVLDRYARRRRGEGNKDGGIIQART